MKVSDSAYKAAVAIIERVNEDSDLDLCVVAQGGHCRDFKGCIDHAASVIAAIIDSHMESGDEMTTWNRRTPDHIPDAREMVDPEMLHALKNAWATLSYMPCMCGYGFICGRCNTFNEIDALLKRVCGDDWYEREFEQYCKENPET